MATLNYPKVYQATRRFDVRRRRVGMWAYALNRITGIGLVVYLYLHLAVLSLLSRGPAAWNSFVSMARSPFYLSLDVILLGGVLIHGLNGLRIALTGFDIHGKFHAVLAQVSRLRAGVRRARTSPAGRRPLSWQRGRSPAYFFAASF